MKSLNYGIEMEMTGITREAAANIIAEYFGTGSARYAGGTYHAYHAEDNQGRTWKAMRDGSIRCQRRENGVRINESDAYSCEVVSPILQYSDIEDLQEIIRKLRQAGALVNESTGIHIHVGAESFTAKTLRNLVNTIASKEDLIYTVLQVATHRELHYCKKTEERFLTALNSRKPNSLEELGRLWYNGPVEYHNNHYDGSRYHGLNLHAFYTKRTVEFRLFNGTLHAGKVKAYIQFCLAVSAAALKARSASCRKVETNNPKYTFRCWLLRLGLIGEEFKTCRLWMLKNLEGNSAWRCARAA